MRLTYDPTTDALYLRLAQRTGPVTTVQVNDDIALDFDEADRLYGIEVLAASRNLALSEILTGKAPQLRVGSRGKNVLEYLGYIQQVPAGRAGRLCATEGETLAMVQRRLRAAAKIAGQPLQIQRGGKAVYFWPVGQGLPAVPGKRVARAL